ncbi:MAG: 16S rRNA (guanine(527)-N(7))-methyltransferase RsmG [Deltaproteobacteria bacterium]|nr:16S rRNA (guanine(527)-N(7))-methyltransferase RsmG [Deltaproteobacteria bacterium]
MKAQFNEILLKSSEKSQVLISEKAAAKFELYYQELLDWNAKVNLTTITAPADAAVKHFLDSLLVLKYMPLAGSLIDIGSGAGFPGIPLKIMLPELSVVLVEAVRKKASFLKQIIRILKLDGIEVYNGRIEFFDRPAAFDYAVSRAFSELGLFCRLAEPYIKPGGLLLAMKGSDAKEQAVVQEMTACGLACRAIHSYKLPLEKGRRSLIILQKCFT